MERGSDKHSPRVDDEIKKDTQGLKKGEPSESRIEEFRKDEEIEPDAPEEGSEPEAPEGDRGPDEQADSGS